MSAGFACWLPSCFGSFFDGELSLLLRANKENLATLGYDSFEKYGCRLDLSRRLNEINYMYTISGLEDVITHLRVPFARLVSKMDARVQKFFYITHSMFSIGYQLNFLFKPSRGKTGLGLLWLMPPQATKLKVWF